VPVWIGIGSAASKTALSNNEIDMVGTLRREKESPGVLWWIPRLRRMSRSRRPCLFYRNSPS
jgi:hypothetical protein